ncbi:MAG TPA: ABC transporter permease subunit [Anaerolineae bacterium]|nr:ABC transporter permease subunit [Anaerolineae bacterium]
MILVTIILGTFGAVLLANSGGQIDQNVEARIIEEARWTSYGLVGADSECLQQVVMLVYNNMADETGLSLPFWPRHIRWTFNALTLNWGSIRFLNLSSAPGARAMRQDYDDVKSIIFQHLPNTLLLVGSAYLLIFMIGIPLALSLSRKHGQWQDKLLSLLAPFSSIPSWVLGLLLIFIFALELRLLPFGGMYDPFPPETKIGYVLAVIKHMLLPVSAIVISLLFQLVYTWRTFFLIYAREDYVELAQAIGLPQKTINRSHVLKPALPYVITSFALTLVSFWQMTTALEIVFGWPGIGNLYILSLPNFWSEQMFPGEMVIVIAIVVVFAYILGFTVLLLDLIYAIVDPRIRMQKQDSALRIVQRTSWLSSLRKWWMKRRSPTSIAPPRMKRRPLPKQRATLPTSSNWEFFKARWRASMKTMGELFSYPSAIVGLAIIALLVGGSIYAVVELPYLEVGERWYTEGLTGKYYAPKLAQPEWINWFRKDTLLSTVVLTEHDDGVEKTIEPGSNETSSVFITFSFDYSYAAMPEELLIDFTPQFELKRPFVFMTWITPDGREIELKQMSVAAGSRIDLAEHTPGHAEVSPFALDVWDEQDPIGRGDPDLSELFLDPNSDSTAPLKGTYELRIEGLLFEDDADLDAELVILGQVYGMAGTDFMRRDLLVPLLWGMPFALAIGLFGAVLTTVASMVLAAAGAWFGGWLDALIQRITEANMILPILALGVLFYAVFNVNIWTILGIIVILNVFGSPTKSFRAAFLQIKEAPYIEAAQAYGVSNWRIILRYMMPRIIPVLIPQLVTLVPAFVFLEATLGMFNIKSMYPTWGRVIYQALNQGASWGSRYYVLGPIALLLMTGFAFALIGYALDRVLNPRLREE